MAISEDQVNRWANPPSETENEKCENAVRQITETLRSHFGNSITIIRQGSHRNRTNIRLDSDIDIAVVHDDYFFPDIAGLSETDKSLYEKYKSPAKYTFSEYKTDIYTLLRDKFGAGIVERKNKCICVGGSASRVNADVVPAYVHKRYKSFNQISVEGIEFITDKGECSHSFPNQHYANGVTKNDETNKSYKSVVRVLKNLRNHLVDKGLVKPNEISSFFLECLVWNCPPSCFKGATWREDAESVTLHIWSEMQDFTKSNDYAEVSDLMWLFRGQTNRTAKQAEDFMLQAWLAIKN